MEDVFMRSGKRCLVLFLAALLTFSQTGAVFASESVSGPEAGVSEEAKAQAEETTVSQPEAEVSEETASQAEDTTVSQPDAGDTESVSHPEAEDPESLSQPDVPAAGESEPEKEDLPFGLNGMPKDFILSEEEKEVKQKIAAHDVVNRMDSMKAGEDYVEDQVIFSCDDPGYAMEVAKAYNGTLLSCELGVAVVKIDTDILSVKDAVSAGADPANSLPPVGADFRIKLEEPVAFSEDEESSAGFSGIMSAQKNAFDARGWSYWKNRFNDPALNPSYCADDPVDKVKNKNMYQWMHDAIGSYAAWGVTKGEGVRVAVIDSGVYKDHPDLKNRVQEVVETVSPNWTDYLGHGTHCAGIIASEGNNGVGGVGVAPEAKIIGIPVFSGLMADNAYISRAVDYVTNKGNPLADVINMSLGGPNYDPIMEKAIADAHAAGITVCVSMGNEYADNVSYPAGYDNVIAVAAVDESLQKSDFSTHGKWADIAAPGTQIYSTWNGRFDDRDEKGQGSYNIDKDYDYWSSWDGTSMACPVVAGVCALYISAAKKAGKTPTPDEVEEALKKSATKLSSPYKIGAGLVNAAGMLKTLEETEAPKITLPAALTSDSKISFSDEGACGGTQGFIYTLNGKKPSAKEGEVKEGIFVPASDGKAEVPVAELIAKGLGANEETKLCVARITGLGTMTEVADEKITYEGSLLSGMVVTGSDVLAKGRSLTYSLNRKVPKNKLEWYLEDAPAGVTINKKTGKVTAKKTAEGSFKVVAKTEEGDAVPITVKLVDGAAKVTLKAGGTDEDVNIPVYDKKGNLKSARLYNADVPGTNKIENQLTLSGSTDKGAAIPVEYISSKTSIAEVDYHGVVRAKKAGTVKITCKAMDGSNKQASVTLKVITPVSKLDLFLDKGMQAVAYGKTMKIRAAIGSAYGKPTVSRLTWDKYPSKVMAYSGDNALDVTSAIEERNLITVNNGNIKVSNKITSLGSYNYFKATVRVKTTDGSEIVKETDLTVIPPTRTIRVGEEMANYTYRGYVPLYDQGIYEFGLFTADTGFDYAVATGRVIRPETVCSDPSVVSAHISRFATGEAGIIYKVLVIPKKPGKASVTIKTTDGSGKKATITFKIIPKPE